MGVYKESHKMRGWLLVSFCMEAVFVLAQNGADSVDVGLQQMKGLTVTEKVLPAAVRSGAPVQTLDKAELERMGVLDVSDAVRHFSGVTLKDYGGVGGLKTVSVRSLGAQHTAVLYDGVAIGDCQSGQVDISRFSLDNVSSLTLTIGQSDNIYQTARMSAAASALSIETSRPDFEDRDFSLSAKVKTGSYGLANPSLFYAHRFTSRLSCSLYGEYLRADGNYHFTMMNLTKPIEGRRNNSDIGAYRAEVNLFARLTERQDLDVKGYLFDSRRGLPGSVVYDNPYAAERLYDRNYFGQLRYENRFSEKWKLKASGKFNYSWNKDTDKKAAGPTEDRFRQTETYLTVTLWATPVKNLSFSLAQDFVYNDLATTLEECQYPERYTSLTAFSAQYRHPLFQVTASLLNTFITERVALGRAADDRKRLSPAVSLTWRPVKKASWRLRASYKDIFRVPTFNDLYYLLIGNSRLRPEKTRQWNVGTTWAGRMGRVADYVSLSVDGYYNEVDDKIVAVPTMFVWKMSNVGKVETYGVDANLAAEWTLAKAWNLGMTAAYSFMQAEDVTKRSSKLWRHQIAYTPKHSGAGGLVLETPWVNAAYNVAWSGERYRLPQNKESNLIDAYADHSVSLYRVFRFKGHKLRLQVDVANLGGKNYEVVRYYPMPGRNFKVSITYSL